MQDVYKNIEECNLEKKCKVLIVFDDMIADMINDKKHDPAVPGLFIRGRKLNIFIKRKVWIYVFGLASARSYKIGAVSNNRCVG